MVAPRGPPARPPGRGEFMTAQFPLPPLAEGDPAAATRAFRACLGQFATGVAVITTDGFGGPVGMTANSFSSLSLDPPLVMWAVSRSARSFAAFQDAARFVIHILGADQVAVSQAFSSSRADKFAGVAWHAGECGPLLD